MNISTATFSEALSYYLDARFTMEDENQPDLHRFAREQKDAAARRLDELVPHLKSVPAKENPGSY